MPHETVESPSPAHNLQHDATSSHAALQTLKRYNLPEENLPDVQAFVPLTLPTPPTEPNKIGRRAALRFLGLSGVALATATSAYLIRTFDEPLNLPDPIADVLPLELLEGEGIAGLENDSFCYNGKVYFSRDGIRDKMESANGMFGWQTLGSTENSELFLNNPDGEDVYSGIDLVAIDGMEYFRMTTIPDVNQVFIQCFENGEWKKLQKIPNTFRPPYVNQAEGRRIDWQNPLATNTEASLLQKDLLGLSYFFPYGAVPDIKVLAPNRRSEITKVPNYPDADGVIASNVLLIDANDLAADESSWEVGIFKGIAAHFLQNIDTMMFENNLSSYDPRTLKYVWGNIEKQLKIPSSLPRPKWWQEEKPYTLFDSVLHPGIYERRLVDMDFQPSAENALASMLYLATYPELAKEASQKFFNLEKPELPPSSNDILSWSSKAQEGWSEAEYYARHEQGAIAYLASVLTTLIEHGTPPECSLDFAQIKRLFSNIGRIIIRYDPWSPGINSPLLEDTVERLYGRYTAGLSPEAVVAIQNYEEGRTKME